MMAGGSDRCQSGQGGRGTNTVSLGAESALPEQHWVHQSLQAEPVAAAKATRKRTLPT